jgi:chemotaxis protein methyltransferase WspC
MSLEEKIVALLHERIGFNPESIGPDKILSTVRANLRARKIPDPEQFLEGLRRGNEDFQSIVDAVIVPETWFFRDGEPFELLKRHAVEWHIRHLNEKMRCLSLPCSTGEEPYSIAMSLLECGMLPASFQIDGVDISPKSLCRAREAMYGQYSFRGKDISFREKYFEPLNGGYSLRPVVKETVQFSQGNLLDPHFMSDGRQYDVIFCRNLLIYFDPPAWKLAIKTLSRLLKDNGILFMGHAEMLEMSAKDFESMRVPCAFAYRKRLAAKSSAFAPAVQVRRKRDSAMPKTARSKTRVKRREADIAAPLPKSVSEKPSGGTLKTAGELADAGKFAEAARICDEHLAANPTCAQAYFLLGLIHEAQGKQAKAEEKYKRALYLDNRHREAMVHMALLLEGRGDAAGAAAMRQRAQRVREAT